MEPASIQRRPRRLTRQIMQRARCRRDASYDGIFWVCVRTTGIFCRPSCPARTPKEANVEYVRSVEAALRAGYRACRRCRPMAAGGAWPDWVRHLMDLSSTHVDRRLTDTDLRGQGICPARARRYFQRYFGMTFQAYHRSRRMQRVQDAIKRGVPGELAAETSGFTSESGFRAAVTKHFHTAPGKLASVTTLVVDSIASPLGRLQLGATDHGVCLVGFAEKKTRPADLSALEKQLGMPAVAGSHPFITQMIDELSEYFAGRRRVFSVPLHIVGTPFRRRVWNALLEVPYGCTASYGQIAARIGSAGGQRAVGQANGSNPISIVIPCHRIIQSNGQLRGYGGGLWRKQWLLDLETGQQRT